MNDLPCHASVPTSPAVRGRRRFMKCITRSRRGGAPVSPAGGRLRSAPGPDPHHAYFCWLKNAGLMPGPVSPGPDRVDWLLVLRVRSTIWSACTRLSPWQLHECGRRIGESIRNDWLSTMWEACTTANSDPAMRYTSIAHGKECRRLTLFRECLPLRAFLAPFHGQRVQNRLQEDHDVQPCGLVLDVVEVVLKTGRGVLLRGHVPEPD